MPLPDLFPPIEPYTKGSLRVDDIHTLYWEACGNPTGVPVLFLHGGPGAGSSALSRRFFDPKFWRIILFDQRGAGRSMPLGELHFNSTEHLIEDIETLRTYLGIHQWHIFGGSWGSTLALAYGQTHPDKCLSFVLRGICLLRPKEIEWFMYGIRKIFPEIWDYFAEIIPMQERDDLLRAYYKILTGPDRSEKTEAIRRWLNYETACSNFMPPDIYDAPLLPDDVRMAMPVIEAHYFLHQTFTPHDKLLQKIHSIRHIPAVIVQGRYDIICPIESAYDLHKAWPEAQFIIVPDAGHSGLEPGVRSTLVQATEKMKSIGF